MRKRKEDILQEKQLERHQLEELLKQGEEKEKLINDTLVTVLRRNLTPEVLSEALDKWEITEEQYNDTINFLK